uniref:Uncharacterized protein n=1 Tax=Setaria digitata TaxID=48799 RepID=A0A915Q088_9BILA
METISSCKRYREHDHKMPRSQRHMPDSIFMTASSRSSQIQSHARSYSQIYPATDPSDDEDDSEYQSNNDNLSHPQQRNSQMESSEPANGYSNNYAKCFEQSKLPINYQISLDKLHCQSCYNGHYHQHQHPPISYQYQSDHKVDDNNHIVIKKIRNFSENTTAHGVRRIFIARNTYTARLWLLGIILCFIILIIQAYQLVMKFNRYEKITSIELKFDYIQFPAVTFCNLNPYKKSLIRSVPSVRDTMDVYENAKSFRKGRTKQQTLFGSVPKRLKNQRKQRSMELFDSEQRHNLNLNYWKNQKLRRNIENGPSDHYFQNYDNTPTIKFELMNADVNDEVITRSSDDAATSSDVHFTLSSDIHQTSSGIHADINTSDNTTLKSPILNYAEDDDDNGAVRNASNSADATVSRIRRMAMTVRYEAIEAHCKCIGKADMECIRFESVPLSDNSKCICTYDNEMNIAWPCFNISIWYEEECSACFEDGFCEPKNEGPIQSANWPCLCRNRTVDSPNLILLKKPHCIWTLNELRQLWVTALQTTTGRTTTERTTTGRTTTPPRRQSARVTAPETVKAMGFTGMTDGVAMLTRAKENLIFTMSALSEVQRIALSQSKREFIEMCSFNGKECDIDVDFKLHVDPEFGNCYTFNWDVNKNHTSSKAGPMYGIRLLLFVNTSDYMATSEAAGVRLAVHSQTDFPFPDTFGYSAPVGFASSFGLKKHIVQRLSAPYGDCQWEKKMNSSIYIYGDYDYNPEGCHRSCFQNALLDKCGCGDPRFPVPKGKTHCSAFNATARGCLEQIIGEIGDFHHITDNLQDCKCKQSCEHEIYSITFSASKWPSGASDLGNCDPNMGEKECEKFYSENAALVEVFYEQLNYELLKESEAYGLVNLLADVGGHLGLWMGFSVITMIECAVLFIDLITLCCNQLKEKREFQKLTVILKDAKNQQQQYHQQGQMIHQKEQDGGSRIRKELL